MASNYDGNKGVNGNGLLYFIGKVKTWIDTYFLKKNLGSSKASKVVVTDSSGNVDVSTITPTELGYLSGINQNIHTALVNKASLSDLSSLGSEFNTFVNTTAPATYQEKIKVGTADSGAVKTISAGSNTSITIDGTTATIASTDTKMSNKSYTAGTDTKVVVGTKITGNNTLADTQKTLTAGSGISITGTTSAITIANTYSYTLPVASTTLGGVKLTNTTGSQGLEIDSNGNIGVKCGYSVTYDESDGTLNVAIWSGGGLEIREPSSGNYGLAIAPSPALTGTPTAPTAATSTNTTQIATTAFVHAAIENADIGGKTYQGNIASEAALKTIKTFKQGQYFTVSSAFTFADGSWALGVGDMLFVKENYTWASGNVDGSKFAAVQGNNDYLTNSELDAIFTEVFGSAA